MLPTYKKYQEDLIMKRGSNKKQEEHVEYRVFSTSWVSAFPLHLSPSRGMSTLLSSLGTIQLVIHSLPAKYLIKHLPRALVQCLVYTSVNRIDRFYALLQFRTFTSTSHYVFLQHFPLIFFIFPLLFLSCFLFLLFYTVHGVEKWKQDFHWFLLIFSQLPVLLFLGDVKI